MPLPIGQQRDQQVGAAQQRRVLRGDAAQGDVVAAAGAAVAAVELERLGRKAGQPGLLIQGFQLPALLGETGGGRDVDLDDTGVGGDRRRRQPRVRRWFVAFDDDRAADLRRRGVHPADQVDEVFQRLGRRHENVEQPAANLGDHRGGRRGVESSVVLQPRLGRRRVQLVADGGRVGDEGVGRGGFQLIASSGSRRPAGESPSTSTMRPRRSRQSALAQPRSSSRLMQRKHECCWGRRWIRRDVPAVRRGSRGVVAGFGVEIGIRWATGSPSGRRALAASPRQGVFVRRPYLRQRQAQLVGDGGQQLAGPSASGPPAGRPDRCPRDRPAACRRATAAAHRCASTVQSASAATVHRDTTGPVRGGPAPAVPTALSAARPARRRVRVCAGRRQR